MHVVGVRGPETSNHVLCVASSITAMRAGIAHRHMLAHQSTFEASRVSYHIQYTCIHVFSWGCMTRLVWQSIGRGSRQSHAHVACNRPRHHSSEHATMLAVHCTLCHTRNECLKHDPHFQPKTGKRLRQHTLAHLTMFCGASHV